MMNTAQEHDDALSAFLDGELSDPQAIAQIRRLAEDEGQRRRYNEYSVVGDVLRGYHHDLPDLTDRVMAALEQEPTLLAPMKKPAAPQRRPLLWLAAAATAAITWGLWSAAPQSVEPMPMASAPADVMPYLAAHQDYVQAVNTAPEMGFTVVSLGGAGR